MAIATYSDLEDRLQKSFTADEQTAATAFLLDAQAAVESYLGYAIEADDDITETVNGTGTPVLRLGHKNIREVISIKYEGEETVDSDSYRIAGCGCLVVGKFGIDFIEGLSNYEVNYKGGWAANDIPQVIKSVVIDIASTAFNAYQSTGVSEVRVGEVAYKYSDKGQDVSLTSKQVELLRPYKCQYIG